MNSLLYGSYEENVEKFLLKDQASSIWSLFAVELIALIQK
jgi:hypothetical protein